MGGVSLSDTNPIMFMLCVLNTKQHCTSTRACGLSPIESSVVITTRVWFRVWLLLSPHNCLMSPHIYLLLSHVSCIQYRAALRIVPPDGVITFTTSDERRSLTGQRWCHIPITKAYMVLTITSVCCAKHHHQFTTTHTGDMHLLSPSTYYTHADISLDEVLCHADERRLLAGSPGATFPSWNHAWYCDSLEHVNWYYTDFTSLSHHS